MTKKQEIEKMSRRAEQLLERIEENKELYKELDQLTEELIKRGFASDARLVLVDNFESKNVIFRPAAVRRFEIKRGIK